MTQIQHKYSTKTIPVQYKYNIFTIQLLYKSTGSYNMVNIRGLGDPVVRPLAGMERVRGLNPGLP